MRCWPSGYVNRPSATTGRTALPQSGGEKSPWLHYWLEYVSRPVISLKKIRYEPFKGRVLFHTTYSDYFKENVHLFDPLGFLAELTQHVCNIQKRAAVAKNHIIFAGSRMEFLGWTTG